MQTSTNPVRLGGLAAVLGGALWAAKSFHDRNDAPPWPTDLTDTLLVFVPLLFLAGFAGLYIHCRGRLRGEWRTVSSMAFGTGAVGLVVSIAGLLTVTFEAGPSWWLEISWWMFVFGFFLGNLGLVFFGNSVLQSRVLGRLKALPLALGVLGILLIPIGDPSNSDLGVYPTLALWILYGLGWAALGFVLLAGYRSPAARPASGGPETNV